MSSSSSLSSSSSSSAAAAPPPPPSSSSSPSSCRCQHRRHLCYHHHCNVIIVVVFVVFINEASDLTEMGKCVRIISPLFSVICRVQRQVNVVGIQLIQCPVLLLSLQVCLSFPFLRTFHIAHCLEYAQLALFIISNNISPNQTSVSIKSIPINFNETFNPKQYYGNPLQTNEFKSKPCQSNAHCPCVNGRTLTI